MHALTVLVCSHLALGSVMPLAQANAQSDPPASLAKPQPATPKKPSKPAAKPAKSVRYQAKPFGFPETGLIEFVRATHVRRDGTIAGVTQAPDVNGKRGPEVSWLIMNGVCAEFRSPLDKFPETATILGLSESGAIMARCGNRLFHWQRGVATTFTGSVAPGRLKESGAVFEIDMLRSGLVHGVSIPRMVFGGNAKSGHATEGANVVSGGGPTAFIMVDGKLQWIGLTEPEFRIGGGGAYCSQVLFDKPDGSIVGVSAVFKPEDLTGHHKEERGSWIGDCGWISRNGRCVPLKPISLDANGVPLCQPLMVLTDGTLVVRIPAGLGLAQDDTVKPIVLPGVKPGTPLTVACVSPNGKHIIIRASDASAPNASLWSVSLSSAPARIVPPAAADAGADLGESKAHHVNDAGRVILSSERPAASAPEVSRAIWTWTKSKANALAPSDIPAREFATTVASRSPGLKQIAGRMITTVGSPAGPEGDDDTPAAVMGQHFAPSKADGLKTPGYAMRGWFYDLNQDRILLPDFGQAMGIADWESKVLAVSSSGSAFLHCVELGATSPETSRTGFYRWTAAEGFQKITLDLPAGRRADSFAVVAIDHLLGPQGETLVATISGLGTRAAQGTQDVFLLTKR